MIRQRLSGDSLREWLIRWFFRATRPLPAAGGDNQKKSCAHIENGDNRAQQQQQHAHCPSRSEEAERPGRQRRQQAKEQRAPRKMRLPDENGGKDRRATFDDVGGHNVTTKTILGARVRQQVGVSPRGTPQAYSRGGKEEGLEDSEWPSHLALSRMHSRKSPNQSPHRFSFCLGPALRGLDRVAATTCLGAFPLWCTVAHLTRTATALLSTTTVSCMNLGWSGAISMSPATVGGRRSRTPSCNRQL